MRITLRLIVSLIGVLGVVLMLSSIWQIHEEKRRITNELGRKSYSLSEDLIKLLRSDIAKADWNAAALHLEEFTQEESLKGVAIFDAQGDTVLSTTRYMEELRTHARIRNMSRDVAKLNIAHGFFTTLGGQRTHVYLVPVLNRGQVVHTISVFHNMEFMRERIANVWKANLLRWLVLSFLISLTTVAVFYLNVMAPIQKTAEWIQKVRLGETAPEKLNPDDVKILAPLAKEVTQMAKSLATARRAAEDEARLRHSSESIWTPDRLKELVRKKLQGRAIFVVSNREPYMHLRRGKEIECVVPASGLVTALEPILKACGGTWIAQGAGDADRETVDSGDKLRVPPEEPSYALRRVWLTKEEEEGYYNGFANEGLWPLCHIAHTRPTFREADWTAYESVNEKFAAAVLEELEGQEEPCVLIQDYHFALLPRLIKSQRPDARVTIFWHIPWPNPESFGICPWQHELLKGMLGADIIGFHTQYHCNNFMQTVDRFLESRIDYERFTVHREGQMTWVKPFPISIAFIGDATNGAGPAPVKKEDLLKPYGLQAEFIGVGVDRLDYTKGILERFRSVEAFLDKNPEYAGRFTFVELGAPSRGLIAKYQQFMLEVEAEAERINGRYKIKNWKPILLLKKHHSQKEILPFYKNADVCMVTSLHDGMNLVAKEFVMARSDESGVLILSQFTGAARELEDALIINPYDIGQAAEAIKYALQMPAAHRQDRMRRMRTVLKEKNIYKWAADVVSELSEIRIDNTRFVGTPL